jgi:hypothetical protein
MEIADFPVGSLISWQEGRARKRYGRVAYHSERYGRAILMVQEFKRDGTPRVQHIGVKLADRPEIITAIPPVSRHHSMACWID